MSDSNFSAIRARLRYESIEEFIDGYARFISAGGMFIPMAPAKLKPVDTTIRFQFLLSEGATALLGEGVVVQVRPPEPNNAKAPVGMLIKFSKLSQESKNLVDQIVAMKEFGSLGNHIVAPDPEPTPTAAVDAPAADEPDDPTSEFSLQESAALAAEASAAEDLERGDEAAEEPRGDETKTTRGPRQLAETEGGLQILAFDDMSDEQAGEVSFDLGAEESDIDEMFAGLFGGGSSEAADDGDAVFGEMFNVPTPADEDVELAVAESEPVEIAEESDAQIAEESSPAADEADEFAVAPPASEAEFDEPEIEEPEVDEPLVEESEVDEPLIEESEVDEPLIEEPEFEEPELEEPLIEEPPLEPLIEEDFAPASDAALAAEESDGELAVDESEDELAVDESEADDEGPLPTYDTEDSGPSLTFPDDWDHGERPVSEANVSADEAFDDEVGAGLPAASDVEALDLEMEGVELIEGSEAELLLEASEPSEAEAAPEPPSDDLDFIDDSGPSELENLLGNLESDPRLDRDMELHLANDPLAEFEDVPEEALPADDDDEESLDFLLAAASKEIASRHVDEPEEEGADILDDLLGDVANLPPPPVDGAAFNAPPEKKKKGFLSKLFGKD